MLPLQGVRIVAISQYGAGPFATLHLADLGAEIIKIEDPATGGDISRFIMPYASGGDSLFYQALNRNKKSIILNLKNPAGRSVFHSLVGVSQAVFNNLRGDQPASLGLDYEGLKGINPKIVCCSLSGFGKSGPRFSQAGYDYLVQGLAGWMALTGEPDSPPTKTGLSAVDFSAGFAGALGLMIGLYKAERTGIGCDVDISLLDTAVSMLNYLATWHLNKGYVPKRMSDSAHPSIVPSQNFPTKDGYVVIMCQKEKFWQGLCKGIDRADLLQDTRFNPMAQRYENRDLLIPILKEELMKKTTAEWLEVLGDKVPCAPVHSFQDVFKEPQLLARHMLVEVKHPEYGALREVGCPIKVDNEEPVSNYAPKAGENTEEILKELGFSQDELEVFRNQGAFR